MQRNKKPDAEFEYINVTLLIELLAVIALLMVGGFDARKECIKCSSASAHLAHAHCGAVGQDGRQTCQQNQSCSSNIIHFHNPTGPVQASVYYCLLTDGQSLNGILKL
jgi:hypothetical protein